LKQCKYSDNYFIFNIFYWFLINYESNQPIKLRHRTRLDGVHDVDVGLHGLVVGVAGPFHHDVRSDAQGQSVDDEGAATGVGADQFPLGLDLVGANVALVGGDADFLIDTGQLAQLLDVATAKVVDVRMPEAGEAAEEEDVPDRIQEGLKSPCSAMG